MTAGERRMISLLVVLSAISGGALMTQALLGKQSALNRRQQTLELRRVEYQAMLQESALWNARIDWMNANQPGMSSENQASQELLESLLAAAAAGKLTVQKKQLHEAVHTPFYHEIGVTLSLTGDLPDVFRWLHGMLTPESFHLVSVLKIMPDAENAAQVSVTTRINRRYAPALTTNEPAEQEAKS